jgi:hypothetical protein
MVGRVVVRPRPATAHVYVVQSGYGSDRSYADVFFPDNLRIHVGDTLKWTKDFHAVGFGPAATEARLSWSWPR